MRFKVPTQVGIMSISHQQSCFASACVLKTAIIHPNRTANWCITISRQQLILCVNQWLVGTSSAGHVAASLSDICAFRLATKLIR